MSKSLEEMKQARLHLMRILAVNDLAARARSIFERALVEIEEQIGHKEKPN